METFSSHMSFILIILKVTKDKLSFEMSTRTLAVSHFVMDMVNKRFVLKY